MRLPNININNALTSKVKSKGEFALKGIGTMKQAIRSNGYVVPNILGEGLPTIGKRANEETYFDVLCKDASIMSTVSNLSRNLPQLAIAGTLGLGTMNMVNSGEGLAPAFMQMAVAAPLAGFGAARFGKAVKNINAGMKAESLLTKGLSSHELEAGINNLNKLKGNMEGAKQVWKSNARYNSLDKMVQSGKNLSQAEIQEYNHLHGQRIKDSFNTKYRQNESFANMFENKDWGGAIQKVKGMGIKTMGAFNDTVGRDLASGAYASQDHLKPALENTKQFLKENVNKMNNIDYMKANNIDPHKTMADMYKKDINPEMALNAKTKDFQNDMIVKKNNPNDKRSQKYTPFGYFYGGKHSLKHPLGLQAGGKTLTDKVSDFITFKQKPNMAQEHQFKL